MNNDFSRGSEWRKWDLHLHTPSSYDYQNSSVTNEDIVNKLIDNNIALAVITDHHYIDVERFFELKNIAQGNVVFLPGIELRTELGGSESVHITVAFPNFEEKSELEDLWNKLNVKLELMEQIKEKGNDCVYVNFENASKIIKELDGFISIHAGNKSNSLENITNALSYKMAIKTNIANIVDFYEIGTEKDISDYKSKVFPSISKIIPLVRGSDNHNICNYQLKLNCWVKADPTFEGLKQSIIQPEERLFIGEIPPRLKQMIDKPSQFMDKLVVNKVKNPKNKTDKWFESVNSIPINSGMVAIIGGKGSGKSALSDIMGQFCYCKTMSSASFLNEHRFRKPPKKYAEDYEGHIIWCNGQTDSNINLMRSDYPTTIEKAQYLPQKYIEDVCNNLGNEFQDEIDKVIFSYIDENKKMGLSSLSDLIGAKDFEITLKSNELKVKLSEYLNKLIVLQNKKAPSYKKEVTDNINSLKKELSNLRKLKPTFVRKPNILNDNKIVNEINILNEQIKKCEKRLKELDQELTNANMHIEQIKKFINEISYTESNLLSIADKINNYLTSNNLVKSSNVSFNVVKDINDLEVAKSNLLRKISRLEILCNRESGESIAFVNIINKLNQKRQELINNTNVEQQQYQAFVVAYKEWKTKILNIIGHVNSNNTLKYYLSELKYINEKLPSDLKEAIIQRETLIKDYYNLLLEKAKIYEEIYTPVEEKLSKILGKIDNEIQFAIDVVYKDLNLEDFILNHINKKFESDFKGKTEGAAFISNLRKEIDLKEVSTIIAFVNNIFCSIEESKFPEKLVNEKHELYEYLVSLKFLDISFSLKMSERSISELSAGEKGILLLVFYLALNKESKPLIIDQPEDNLDNQSVYSKLVPCIQEAKINRQLIIVTHNPNIAIACDAEQIIYCAIDKKNDNEIKYVSGSIENPEIKEHIVDILEGTEPAFNLRKRKYNI